MKNLIKNNAHGKKSIKSYDTLTEEIREALVDFVEN